MGNDCPTKEEMKKILTCQDIKLKTVDEMTKAKNKLDDLSKKREKQLTYALSGDISKLDTDPKIVPTNLDNYGINEKVDKFLEDTSKNYFEINNRILKKLDLARLQKKLIENTCELNTYYEKNKINEKDKLDKLTAKVNMNNRMTEYYDENIEDINTWTYYGKYLYWLVITILTIILCYISYKAGYIMVAYNYIKKKLGLANISDEIEKKKLQLSNQYGGNKIVKKLEKENLQDKIFKFFFKKIKVTQYGNNIDCYNYENNQNRRSYYTEVENIYPSIKYNAINNKQENLYKSYNEWINYQNRNNREDLCNGINVNNIDFNIIPKGINRIGKIKYDTKLKLDTNDDEYRRKFENIDNLNNIKYHIINNPNLSFLNKLNLHYEIMKNKEGINDVQSLFNNSTIDNIERYYQDIFQNKVLKQLKEKDYDNLKKTKKNINFNIFNKFKKNFFLICEAECKKAMKQGKKFFEKGILSDMGSKNYFKVGKVINNWNRIKKNYVESSKKGFFKVKYNNNNSDSVLMFDKNNNDSNSVLMFDKNNNNNNNNDNNDNVNSKVTPSKIPKKPKFYIKLLLVMILAPMIIIPISSPIIALLKPYLLPNA